MKIKSFDALALSQYEINDDIPLDFRSNLVRLPGQAGAFDADGDGQYREPLIVTRSFEIVESAYATVDDTLDSIRAKANTGLRWLIIEMRDGDERGTWAKLKRVQAPYKPEYLEYLPVQLTFEIPWPWLEDADDIGYLDDGGVFDDGGIFDENYTPQSGAGTFSINNTGGDRITRGLLVVKGASNDPKIYNTTTGEWVQYTGTIPAGSFLLIDLGAQTATIDGTSVWSSISIGDSQTRWFSLAVGSNSIEFTGGGTLEVHWARVY
jgi:hypothetical protein